MDTISYSRQTDSASLEVSHLVVLSHCEVAHFLPPRSILLLAPAAQIAKIAPVWMLRGRLDPLLPLYSLAGLADEQVEPLATRPARGAMPV